MPAEDHLPRLAAPAQRALASIGVTRLAQVAKHTRGEILALHGMGRKAVEQLETALRDRGMTFADEQ